MRFFGTAPDISGMTELIEPQRTIASRSCNGCRVCRLRRVKCDENRNDKGQCGSCARLGRQCDWTRQWKFVDITATVENQYVRRSEPGVSGHANQNIAKERTFVFVDMFEDQLGYPTSNEARTLARTITANPAQSRSAEPPATEPNLESGFGPRQPTFESRIHWDVMSYGARSLDNLKHLLLFESVVCKKIIPMAFRFKLNIQDNQNVFLAMAQKFSPLLHAICAITLLDSGLNSRPELVAGSFQHYDRAMSVYHRIPQANSDALFFLHFILLIYDIACASQRWPDDRGCWTLHLSRLANLVNKSSSPTNRRLKAYLSWYILLLDSQAGLNGIQESGQYVRAILDIDCRLPPWPVATGLGETFVSAGSAETFLQAHKLSLLTFQMSAEQSQLALNLRRTCPEDLLEVQHRRQQIQQLSDRHAQIWSLNRPKNIVAHEHRVVPPPDRRIITSTTNFARLQYSVLSLHLHTSMYPQQRMSGGLSALKDAENCTYIINAVRESFLCDETENIDFLFPLFLAGVATKKVAERKEALEMLSRMQRAGLPGAVNRAKHFLERVVKEQALKQADGGSADEVDWIDLSQEIGLRNIIFGL